MVFGFFFELTLGSLAWGITLSPQNYLHSAAFNSGNFIFINNRHPASQI